MMRKILSILVLIFIGIYLTGCADLKSNDGPFTITYDSQGGSYIEPQEYEALKIGLPDDVPTKDGYIFQGWYLDPEGLYPMAFNAGLVADLTLYAIWIPE